MAHGYKRLSPIRGDLVSVVARYRSTGESWWPDGKIGIVLNRVEANVYEPAECMVYFDEYYCDEWINVRELRLLTDR